MSNELTIKKHLIWYNIPVLMFLSFISVEVQLENWHVIWYYLIVACALLLGITGIVYYQLEKRRAKLRYDQMKALADVSLVVTLITAYLFVFVCGVGFVTKTFLVIILSLFLFTQFVALVLLISTFIKKNE